MSEQSNFEPDQAADPAAPEGTGAQAGDTASEAALRRERDDLYERLLRKSAEFDNFRKRVEREKQEFSAWAAADVLTDVVSIADDFERALDAQSPAEAQAYKAGVELIYRQLAELLKKRGVTAIEALGTDFDPNLHQAVAYDETPGAREGEVIAVFRKGYMLGERLLRPAMVKVAKAS